ncbi:MAG: DUF6159 family protein [Candidatus Thalassarchaeaceae archaeon]|jgi:hypothetical protein|nr:DUF6159 family protein [Candidatus Thalassarchaeaceae archaeon]
MMMRRGQSKRGFMERIRRGWRVTKLGMHVVRADPELMVYMLFSGICSIIAAFGLVSFSGGIGYFTGGEEMAEDGIVVGVFLSYMVIAIITVFWNAAIVASAHERLTAGTNPSFSYGIRQALKCLPQIFVWGLISGTVGLIIMALESLKESENPVVAILGGIASFLVQVAWWITTFFVVPMIVLDNIGVGESMKRSPELFQQTWGEDVVATTGTGVINILVCVLIVIICVPLFALGELAGGLALLLMFVGIATSVLFFTACEAVNRVSLYYFAKTGEAPPLAQKYGLDF